MSVSLINGHIDPDKKPMTFEDVKRIRKNPTAEDVDNKELHRLIDEVIEKQMPKKVKMTNDLYPMAICPCCENEFIPHTGFEYCHYCGQAIDWSDRE